jgi:hypothetical protein
MRPLSNQSEIIDLDQIIAEEEALGMRIKDGHRRKEILML